jgi:8-oxo-dGTP diphosphatase
MVPRLSSVRTARGDAPGAILPDMPTYEYERPALTADAAVLRGPVGARELLLVRRGTEPYEGCWALPGGFVDADEPLETAARRELVEETGLAPSGAFRQVATYGDPGRDPRGWTVTVLFAVELSPGESGVVLGGDDAAEAAWHPLVALPPLAFDHDRLARDAVELIDGLQSRGL